MSSSRILFPQFRDEQSANRYPFADSASLVGADGLKIDNDVFIDASFFGIGLGGRLYLSAVIVSSQTVTFTIGDPASTTRLTGSYAILTPPENGVVELFDGYGRPGGMLLGSPAVRNEDNTIREVSSLLRFSTWSIGEHRFTVDATEFVSTVVIPANEPGVRALIPETGQLQTGDVWLVGNNGIVLRAEGENVIRVDIIGAPLFKRLVCAPQTEFPTKKFLRTVSGCGPDEFGNFIFTATDKQVNNPTIRIYPTNSGTLTFDTIGPSVT
jgi:hypothetical protein